ncbi:MAG: exonuclease domain-containing protein [Armatimonadota bacterium]
MPSEILIVDVEATCWRGAPPPGEEREIIEIGACLLCPSSGERSARESLLVRPARSQVSPFCTELTGITSEMTATGIPFAEACAELRRRYRSAERTWASYGDYDRKQFLAQCASFGVDYPFGPRHLNVKALFARQRRLRRQVGMAGALKLLNIPLEGSHHRAGDDAWNIAAVLAATLRADDLSLERALELAGTCREPVD